MQEQFNILISSFHGVIGQLTDFLPKLLFAFVLLFFGWIIAKLVRGGVRRLLALAHFYIQRVENIIQPRLRYQVA